MTIRTMHIRIGVRRRCTARAFFGIMLSITLLGCEQQPVNSEKIAGNKHAVIVDGELQLNDWVADPTVVESESALQPIRIVSAAPMVTEICCALGLRDSLVGRTRYCDYPPDIENVQSVGALIDVNVEVLLALRPDLILVSGTSRSQLDRFATLDLRIESVPDADLDDLYAAIRRIGELTGRPLTAERLCKGIAADLESVTKSYAKAAPARVLLLTGTLSDPPRPPYVAGPGSFYDAMLQRAGHTNTVQGKQIAFAPLSLEFIVRADPDVIIELDPDGRQRPGGDEQAVEIWSKIGALKAISSRRVHVLTGSQHYLLGPRIALTYEELCRRIDGESDE